METCAHCFQPMPNHDRSCRSAYVFKIDEEARQLMMLSLAVMTQSSPGFDYAAGEVAAMFRSREMFEHFKALRKGSA